MPSVMMLMTSVLLHVALWSNIIKCINDKLINDCNDAVCLHDAATDFKSYDVTTDSGEVDVASGISIEQSIGLGLPTMYFKVVWSRRGLIPCLPRLIT